MRLWTDTLGTGRKQATLIHGFTADSGIWFEFAPWLAAHDYTVTTVDLRGHGHSPRADSYSYQELADDLVETIPAGRDLIVGHSLGGLLLAHTVERLRPRKAMYLDPAWDLPEDETPTLLFRPDGTPMSVEEIAAQMPTRTPAQHRVIAGFAERFDLSMFTKAQGELPEPDLPSVPAVPTLVVVAGPSRYVPLALQRRLLTGGYEVRTVPGGHHDLQLDDLPATQRLVEDWL